VPGLVLAVELPGATVVLVESKVSRATWLTDAASRLGLGDRVEVCSVRAEELAHDPSRRETFDLVTARSFGAPPVTAEIGAGLVAVGGLLVVSEPPTSEDRWPDPELAGLGFGPAELSRARGAHFVRIVKVRRAPEWSPRRRGRATKRPLW
jgi:16S rRNA (guanine527-N7)-methyltransferase